MKKYTSRFNRRTAPRWVKTSIIIFFLIGVGSVVIIMAKDTVPLMHAVASPAGQVPSTGMGEVTMAPEEQLVTDVFFLSHDVNDKISSPVDNSRECRAEQGIATDCVYN